jgi:hypothetical protein
MLKKAKEVASFISYWCIPPGIEAMLIDVARLGYILLKNSSVFFTKPRLGENRKLKNIHAGQRCFILANGPSILKEDLTPLKDEICFSVSNFYKHPLYSTIKPCYHCVPNLALQEQTETDIITWFNEMHRGTMNAHVFLGFRQKRIVQKNKLFPGRKVNFLLTESMHIIDGKRVRDLGTNLLNPESVPIMTLLIALYMGFTKIYLLGVDHDYLKSGQYRYFFDRKEMVLKDACVSSDGQLLFTRVNNFIYAIKLWKQYILINKVAKEKGVEIVNLNQGSYLDVFPFNDLATVLRKSKV